MQPLTIITPRHHHTRRRTASLRPWRRARGVVEEHAAAFTPLIDARAMALKWPVIGDVFVAELDLEPGNGFCLADTGQPGHWTLWGRPLQLLGSIADIVHVEA